MPDVSLQSVCTTGVVAEPSWLGTVQTLDKHACKLVDTYQALVTVKEVPPV